MDKDGKPPSVNPSVVLTDGSHDVQHEAPKLQISVAFRHLDCHGFIASSQRQTTFLAYIFYLPRLLVSGLRPPARQKVAILRDFEGIVLPGEMLLVLGRPGSGCSTFLKTLSGDTHGFHIADDAAINYQGIPYRRFHQDFKGERVYVAELDVHFPELTLGQTLHFAISTRQDGAVAGNERDVASKFGLSEALDTRIGDAFLRGISGGEKRRTSIAEAFIGGAQFQCWDNSTRGLDALTARRFIELLRTLSNSQKSTVAMSLYQASEAMYQTFDNVILLYEGRQIYFGPAQAASDYFIRLGFVRPRRITTADFLTSLTNPAERVVRPGYENRVPRLPEEFANMWKASPEAKVLRARIDDFSRTHPLTDVDPGDGQSLDAEEKMVGTQNPSLRTSTFPISIPRQIGICLDRAVHRLHKSLAAELSAVIAHSVLGVIIGSVFYNLEETADMLQQRTLVLFFSLVLNAFAPSIEVLKMWAQRPIVEKHHRYAFYHPFTERSASIVCDLPAKLFTSFSMHLPIYFMANLRRSAPAFFVYWLFMLVNLITMSTMFRMIGSVSRTHQGNTIPVSVTALLLIIYTGFIVPPDYMRPWLGWVWRINPIAYTYESLVINEMRDRQFPCSTMIPAGPSYAGISLDHKTCAYVGSKTGQQIVQGTTYIDSKYGYLESHLWRNLAILVAMAVAFCTIHLVASEYVQAQPSKGEVLVFRPRDPRKRTSLTPEVKVESLEANTKKPDGNMAAALSHQSRTFQWTNLNFEVNGRQILHDIHGWVKPKTLTALMGVTGAGKTSLLDALANRTTSGKVTGQVLVNGFPRNASFQRKVGYVQQEDFHLASMTVCEALEFSALLRQPASTSKAEKLAYVDSILDMMDMRPYADAVVGVPGQGLNIEQRRRLTIAVEMAAKPEILLFLDEPTSGLDSETAWSICTLLRKLADNGQTILCTIHQPSSQLFMMFDRLLLLSKGGQTLYFGDIGDNASTLIDYFESNGAPTCHPELDNPAEWILEVTGNTPRPDLPESEMQKLAREWPQKWDRSQQKQQVLHEIGDLNHNGSELLVTQANSKDSDREYASSLFQQMVMVSKSILQDQWRDAMYLYSKIGLSIALALVNGISFYNTPLDLQGVINLFFSIFLVTQLFTSVDHLVVPHFSKGRQLFEARDRNSKTYSWVVFVAANVFVELLWQTVISVPTFAAWYYPTGLQNNSTASFGTAERGALTFMLVWLFHLWASTASQALAAGIENDDVAIQMGTLLYWLTLVFCGILVSPDKLPRFWIFMYRVSPLTYMIEGLAVAGLADAKIGCSSIETLRIQLPDGGASRSSCGEYLAPFVDAAGGSVLNPLESKADCLYCPVSDVNTLLNSFGMVTDHAWRNVGLMAVYVCFNVAVTFGIYYLVRVPKKPVRRDA